MVVGSPEEGVEVCIQPADTVAEGIVVEGNPVPVAVVDMVVVGNLLGEGVVDNLAEEAVVGNLVVNNLLGEAVVRMVVVGKVAVAVEGMVGVQEQVAWGNPEGVDKHLLLGGMVHMEGVLLQQIYSLITKSVPLPTTTANTTKYK